MNLPRDVLLAAQELAALNISADDFAKILEQFEIIRRGNHCNMGSARAVYRVARKLHHHELISVIRMGRYQALETVVYFRRNSTGGVHPDAKPKCSERMSS